MKLPRILTALGINFVPAFGWLFGEWSSGTTLLVYWSETVMASFFIALRVLIHQRVAPRKGHLHYTPTNPNQKHASKGTFLQHFLPTTLIFSGAHGVFLVILLTILSLNGFGAQVHLNLREILTGMGLILAFQIVDFLIDLLQIRSRPFRWIESLAERNLGRVFVIHLTLIGGIAAAAYFDNPRGFFLVFVILKTLLDLSFLLPQYDPDEPPAWLCKLMDKVPKAARKPGLENETFADFWKEGKSAERARRARNEEPDPR